MKTILAKLAAICLLLLIAGAIASPVVTETVRAETTAEVSAEETDAAETADSSTSSKALAACIAIGIAALGGALAMGQAISKSAESISRQPEAGGQIRTSLMLGLVFIETAIIYALIVAILVIFVL